jgi:hypothetical protein
VPPSVWQKIAQPPFEPVAKSEEEGKLFNLDNGFYNKTK